MPSMTPVRVRGKRNGTEAEKWRAGKQRKYHPPGSRPGLARSLSVQSFSSGTKQAQHARRKRHDPELSRLEDLPTEVVQAIFLFSANVNLPLASPRIASQLSSRHLYHEITSQILRSSLVDAREFRKDAVRLMSSRFFTWEFFKTWLHDEYERLNLREEWESTVGPTSESLWLPEELDEWIWRSLHPNTSLSPPKKLLRRPFTVDKVQFLHFITSSFRDGSVRNDPSVIELAREGFEQVIADAADDTLPSFWALGMHVDTEVLRQAVIDAGCHKNMVRKLLMRAMHPSNVSTAVDFLDPALWAWADRARKQGDERGLSLMKDLREAAMCSGRKEAEIEDAKPAVSL